MLTSCDIFYHQRGLKYLYIRFLGKRLCFEKTSTITKNLCGKFPWWRKNIYLWKTFLMKENFLDERKIFFLWKTSLMKEKTFLLDNFLIKKISGKRRFKCCLVQEQILNALVSFAVDKISIIFALVKMIVSQRLLNKYYYVHYVKISWNRTFLAFK